MMIYELTREQAELMMKAAFYDGLETGVNDVEPLPGTHRPPPEALWQESETKKLLDRLFGQST